MLISTWEWIRLLGFLAYFYFTISIIFGLLRKSSFVKSHKNLIYQIHQNAGWLGLITVIGHLLVLVIDQYKPYSLVEILIPFSAKYESLPSALGTIAFYLFIMVLMTSDLWIRTMNRTLWKKLHFLVLPAWVISLAHGVLIGTDTENMLIIIFYVVSGGLTMLVLVARTISQFMKKVNISTSRNN
ncbi:MULTISPECIES: ferric reductase-like transmembrane domain-containing protein [unclassified Lysinibacillus]|uniref:ferric reductase-like transmembrane domain-containing protein n=1 Tax=unclassified Lysinibacillus TaxID=2636778 RepID=UPI0025565D67|nr:MULTISPECIES: ferric reductase-like transmembrane domain-containing protein [unclassified Lysinibacillus]MDM5248784.1 ferric reductase-like transmembrane domain-containing protein [Lysinibacillus sp. G4S2]